MSEHGATLQIYNQELVNLYKTQQLAGLEDLKKKRNQLQKVVHRQQAEMSVLDNNIRILQEKSSTLNESLQNNRALYQNYDSTIGEKERGFKKILESSQTLLQVIHQDIKKIGSNDSEKNFF